jgi:hypothetical protein
VEPKVFFAMPTLLGHTSFYKKLIKTPIYLQNVDSTANKLGVIHHAITNSLLDKAVRGNGGLELEVTDPKE